MTERHTRLSSIAALIGLVVAAAPAHAATHQVGASDNVFAPADVTIVQGDSVTWANSGAFHNVRFDDGSFVMPSMPDSSPWSATRTFGTVGTFRYHCEAHGAPGGVGMSGAVYVQPALTTSPAGQPVSADRTAPALTLSGKTRQRVLRPRAFLVRVEVNEASLVIARAAVSIPGKRKRLRARGVSTQLAPRTASELTLSFSRKTARAFRRALRKHSRLTAKVTVTARDPAGNTTLAQQRIVFKT
jgi:plastocyanin